MHDEIGVGVPERRHPEDMELKLARRLLEDIVRKPCLMHEHMEGKAKTTDDTLHRIEATLGDIKTTVTVIEGKVDGMHMTLYGSDGLGGVAAHVARYRNGNGNGNGNSHSGWGEKLAWAGLVGLGGFLLWIIQLLLGIHVGGKP